MTQQQIQLEKNVQDATRMPHTDTACKRAQTEQQQSAQYKDFKLLTHSLMGVTTVLEETPLTVKERAPDVTVYTETKLTDESRNQLDNDLPNYKLYPQLQSQLDQQTQ